MKGVAVLEIRLPFVKIIFDKASTLEAAIPMGVDVEHVNGGTDAKSPKANELSTLQRWRRTLRWWRRLCFDRMG